MGLCISGDKSSPEEKKARKEELHKSKQIETHMNEDHKRDQSIHKLLLLGAGESGKSTLFKQLMTIYGSGFSEEDRKSYRSAVHSNIMANIKTLVEQSDNPHWGSPIASGLSASKQAISDFKHEIPLDSKIAEHIERLWADPGIQATYEHRSRYQLVDNADYFFRRIRQVATPDYSPTIEDVMRVRVRTTGIVEQAFTIEGNEFRMFDVGGQRNERKKWIHCFEHVTAVLFVAAISAFDLTLFEDDRVNRMAEALKVFEEILNSPWFKQTSMILFLNKRDLFAEKIKKVKLRDYFPDYLGENNYEDAVKYIISIFHAKNQNPDRTIYTHVTCATDSSNVQAVFNAVKDIIIKRSLQEGGLL
jgi:GTPase SAR1 family protein